MTHALSQYFFSMHLPENIHYFVTSGEEVYIYYENLTACCLYHSWETLPITVKFR